MKRKLRYLNKEKARALLRTLIGDKWHTPHVSESLHIARISWANGIVTDKNFNEYELPTVPKLLLKNF